MPINKPYLHKQGFKLIVLMLSTYSKLIFLSEKQNVSTRLHTWLKFNFFYKALDWLQHTEASVNVYTIRYLFAEIALDKIDSKASEILTINEKFCYMPTYTPESVNWNLIVKDMTPLSHSTEFFPLVLKSWPESHKFKTTPSEKLWRYAQIISTNKIRTISFQCELSV